MKSGQSIRLPLFVSNSPGITVTIEAYFDDHKLFIEGYDIGKVVKDIWGDSDYEYTTIVSPDEVKKLYPLFGVQDGNKNELLWAIQKKFHSNSCYSEFNDFLMKNNIKAEGFSWT
jgi:hypothetical protein